MKLRDHPELLPVEDLDVGATALVVGRETRLASGQPDLLMISNTGDLIIVEMKTGPDNGDFRRALAQLIDYGSDLWGMALSEFEEQVAVPYFAGSQCRGPSRGASRLDDALTKWLEVSESEDESEPAAIQTQLERDLRTGAFTYVLAAQSLTPSMERSTHYLNATMREARFYGVEIVKFTDGDNFLTAFEGRVVAAPSPEKVRESNDAKMDVLLEGFSPDHVIAEQLIRGARELGMTVFPGQRGFSLKVPVADRETPVSVAWLYPIGRSGPHGAKDLTLGYQQTNFDDLPASQGLLQSYVSGASKFEGTQDVPGEGLVGVFMPWSLVSDQLDEILTLLEQLVSGEAG